MNINVNNFLMPLTWLDGIYHTDVFSSSLSVMASIFVSITWLIFHSVIKGAKDGVTEDSGNPDR